MHERRGRLLVRARAHTLKHARWDALTHGHHHHEVLVNDIVAVEHVVCLYGPKASQHPQRLIVAQVHDVCTWCTRMRSWVASVDAAVFHIDERWHAQKCVRAMHNSSINGQLTLRDVLLPGAQAVVHALSRLRA